MEGQSVQKSRSTPPSLQWNQQHQLRREPCYQGAAEAKSSKGRDGRASAVFTIGRPGSLHWVMMPLAEAEYEVSWYQCHCSVPVSAHIHLLVSVAVNMGKPLTLVRLPDLPRSDRSSGSWQLRKVARDLRATLDLAVLLSPRSPRCLSRND